MKCVPQQSRALNFKEGVLMIETSNNRNKFNSKISFSPDESVKDETICRLKDVLQLNLFLLSEWDPKFLWCQEYGESKVKSTCYQYTCLI